MVRKSAFVSIFSFAIYFIPAFFFWYYKESYKLGSSFFWDSAIEFIFYSLPVLPITFVVLLGFNSWFSRNIRKQSTYRNNKFYFLLTVGAGILITLGFTLFDYFQFNRFGAEGGFLHILAGYSEIFIFIFIVLLLNRKIYFNGFRHSKQF